MNDIPSRSDGATPLNDDDGKVIGYFFPARAYERWQARVADMNRPLAAPRPAVSADAAAPSGDAPPAPLRFDEVLEMLKAVADSDRLRMLLELKAGPRNVGALAQAIGTEIVNASHHLSVLRNAKVVLSEKQGRYVNYRLNPAILTVNWIHKLLFESEMTFALHQPEVAAPPAFATGPPTDVVPPPEAPPTEAAPLVTDLPPVTNHV